jgi:hypothetical protein
LATFVCTAVAIQPIPVVVKGRRLVFEITVVISVIIIRVSPIREAKCHDVKAKKETAINERMGYSRQNCGTQDSVRIDD